MMFISELKSCLNFLYTFRLSSAEDAKDEEEIEEYETDEDVNVEEKEESPHSSTEVIDLNFTYLQGQN